MSTKRTIDPPRNYRINFAFPATWEPETPEALQNDVVLENIFKFLGYKDLKSCRQVGNIAWLRNSKKAWWARTKVRLMNEEREANPIPEYLHETEINSNATNYKLDGIKKNYFGFWDRFGHSIKYLQLDNCRLDSSDQFRQIFFTQCPNLEKLVAFHITLETGTDFKEPTEWEEPQFGQQNNLKYIDFLNPIIKMPVSWVELLSHFPKLQFLKTFVSSADVNLFKTISMIRQHDPKMLNLKHVEIRCALSRHAYDESIRSVFLDPKLSLETILIFARKCKPETLLDILDLHAKSLKKLSLEGGENPHTPLRNPRQPLPALEELEITFCIFPADIFKYTPNVQKVKLRFENPSSYSILEMVDSNLQVNTCKELKFYVEGEWGDTPDSAFVFFLRAFPSLETLHTRGLNNRKFSLICEHLTKLVSLKIEESTVDVTGLLGYNPDSKAGAGARKPSIANLKDLQSLLVKGESLAGIEMNNGSDVFEELKKLPHLKEFQLENYKMIKGSGGNFC